MPRAGSPRTRPGNGLTGRRDYDPAGGLVTDIRVYDGLAAIKDHGFRFDLLGNLEFREDRPGARREDFAHDTLNRLTRATVIDSATLAQRSWGDSGSRGSPRLLR